METSDCGYYGGHEDQNLGHITYSQNGEDLMILNLFALMGIDKPSYLDIGAHHPVNISNTKLLYDHGSRGVNVDANAKLIDIFMHYRPDDININTGVGVIGGMATFYKYDDYCGRNTFSCDEVNSCRTKYGREIANTTVVNMLTLNTLVGTVCKGVFPDFLNIDIEGLDYDVLATTSFFKSAPKIICVEARRNGAQGMKEMLHRKDFRVYCRMGENLIFVNKYHIEAVL